MKKIFCGSFALFVLLVTSVQAEVVTIMTNCKFINPSFELSKANVGIQVRQIFNSHVGVPLDKQITYDAFYTQPTHNDEGSTLLTYNAVHVVMQLKKKLETFSFEESEFIKKKIIDKYN